jgi:hypothetical protein
MDEDDSSGGKGNCYGGVVGVMWIWVQRSGGWWRFLEMVEF